MKILIASVLLLGACNSNAAQERAINAEYAAFQKQNLAKWQASDQWLMNYYKEKNKTNAELRQKPAPQIGMTATQVRAATSWGSPYKINKTTTTLGETEQWVYEEDIHRPGIQNGYLYFTNDILTAIQNLQ